MEQCSAGQHEIRFEYRQRGLRRGLIISILTLATLVALGFSKIEI
jgi:hypothetical protein